MRCKNILCFLICSCFGCSMFQQIHKTKNEELAASSSHTDLSITSDSELDLSTKVLTFKKDSANHDYTVQVWPQGNFTFSPEHGFVGQAQKIEITGSKRHVAASSDLLSVSQKGKEKTQTDMKQNAQSSLKSVDVTTATSPSWKWIIIGTAGLLSILLIWRFRVSIFK